jgi:hypothetical protein
MKFVTGLALITADYKNQRVFMIHVIHIRAKFEVNKMF